jgi:cytochrome P450
VAADKAQIADALGVFERWFIALGLPFGRHLLKLPLPFVRRFERSRDGLRQTIARMIGAHRRGGDGHDLLSMLLAARDVEGDGGGLTDEQLVDEITSFFLAGHESTALALTWTWALLAAHPDAGHALAAELDGVLGDRDPTIDDLPALPYTRSVLAEAMRLYPPVWAISRQAVDDCQVGGCQVPRGAVITLCPYLTHRDPRWWPDADRFAPERWASDASAGRPRYAYVPFGAGNRLCIGEHFAWMEAMLILAVLARRWSARVAPGHVVGTRPVVTLRPRGGRPMVLQRRGVDRRR